MIFRLLIAAGNPLPLRFFDSLELWDAEIRDGGLSRMESWRWEPSEDGLKLINPSHDTRSRALQVRARGADLIDVSVRLLGDAGELSLTRHHQRTLPEVEVTFMHRTVHEFLCEPSRARLLDNMLEKPFNPDQYLYRHWAKELIQICDTPAEYLASDSLLVSFKLNQAFKNMVGHIRIYEMQTKSTDVELLDAVSLQFIKRRDLADYVRSAFFWSDFGLAIINLWIREGLCEYVSAKLAPDSTWTVSDSVAIRLPVPVYRFTTLTEHIPPLAVALQDSHTTHQFSFRDLDYEERKVEMVRLLLKKGFKPSEFFQRDRYWVSPWTELLMSLRGTKIKDTDMQIVAAMVEAGACNHFFNSMTQIFSEYHGIWNHLSNTQRNKLKVIAAKSKSRHMIPRCIQHIHCYIYGIIQLLWLAYQGPRVTNNYHMDPSVIKVIRLGWPGWLAVLLALVHRIFGVWVAIYVLMAWVVSLSYITEHVRHTVDYYIRCNRGIVHSPVKL
jgi:hypothetical protein